MLIEIIFHADHLNFQSEEEPFFSFPLHNKYSHTDYNFSDDDRYASNSNSFLLSHNVLSICFVYIRHSWTFGFSTMVNELFYTPYDDCLLEFSPAAF